MTKSILSQKEIMELMIPVLCEKGRVYRKVKQVLARPAKAGEIIETITSDGPETQNTAKEGDFIIQNQTKAKEEYIIGGDKFRARYEFCEGTTSEYNIYNAIGKVTGIELTADFLQENELPDEFYFMAPWGTEMVAKIGDFLVTPPDESQIYRIARAEFFETYEAE